MPIFSITGASMAGKHYLAHQSHPRSSLGIESCSTRATHAWSDQAVAGAYVRGGWAKNSYDCPAACPIAGRDSLLPKAAVLPSAERYVPLLVCDFAAQSAAKSHTEDRKYHAAVRPERSRRAGRSCSKRGPPR